MIYTDTVIEVLRFLGQDDVHGRQFDRAGAPYVLHPFYLAVQMPDEASTLVALLHDVAEDCPGYGVDVLQQRFGLSDAVAGALRLLCHDKATPYLDYVREIARGTDEAHVLARRVKLADLAHNMTLERSPQEQRAAQQERINRKYIPALEILRAAGR